MPLVGSRVTTDQTARTETAYNLCCVCGTIACDRDWTYWHPHLDEATEKETPWVPARPGESDPMAKCPACGWEHRDTDDGSGFYQGGLGDMEEQRAKDEPECADWWAEAVRRG
jgi:hypothetical protein